MVSDYMGNAKRSEKKVLDYQLPRVLVVAQNRRHKFTGGGVVLSNLFHQYPEGNLKFIHRDQAYDLENRQGEYRVNWRWVKLNLFTLLSNFYKIIRLHVRDGTLFNVANLRAIVQQSSHFSPPKKIMSEIELFQPQVIYAQASDAFWSKSIVKLASTLDSPHIIHFMDNHLDRKSNSNSEEVIFNEYKQRIYGLTLTAKKVLAISESMAQAYGDRFKCPVDVFRAAIDVSQWPKPREKISLKKCVKIGYVGSLEESQIPSLLDLIEVVNDLNETSSYRIKIILHLTSAYKASVWPRINTHRFVSFVEHPNFSDLKHVLSDLDLLVSLYGFGADSRAYYKYSFATKIVPYMLSGTPIMVYGPVGIAPVEYARAGDWSILIDIRSQKLLADSVNDFLEKPEDKQEMVIRAWESAVKNHDLNSNALKFQSVLQDASVDKRA
jgi:glycosyltransferase involved in cell wall biosynthesis